MGRNSAVYKFLESFMVWKIAADDSLISLAEQKLIGIYFFIGADTFRHRSETCSDVGGLRGYI